jgi:hypothetical protein
VGLPPLGGVPRRPVGGVGAGVRAAARLKVSGVTIAGLLGGQPRDLLQIGRDLGPGAPTAGPRGLACVRVMTSIALEPRKGDGRSRGNEATTPSE